jgi:hypothetical protein
MRTFKHGLKQEPLPQTTIPFSLQPNWRTTLPVTGCYEYECFVYSNSRYWLAEEFHERGAWVSHKGRAQLQESERGFNLPVSIEDASPQGDLDGFLSVLRGNGLWHNHELDTLFHCDQKEGICWELVSILGHRSSTLVGWLCIAQQTSLQQQPLPSLLGAVATGGRGASRHLGRI